MSKQYTVCIINRNYPPLRGATGYHAHQLARYLTSQDIDVQIVTTALRKDQVKTTNIHYVSPIYNGSTKHLRLLSSYIEASKLIAKAVSLDADCYIVMTDPPLLNYVASKKLKGHQWILWTMDLFPDGFVANGLVSSNNFLLGRYQKQLIQHPPQLLITLGKQQGAFLKKNYYPSIPIIAWPIGLRADRDDQVCIDPIDETPQWREEGKIVLGYVGNIGEAHNPEVLIWLAEALNPEKHILILSCQGTHKKLLEATLGQLDHVKVVSEIPASHMFSIDIHLVILRSEWTHICVPSKAISAIQYGGTVLFYGSKDSDTWQHVAPCGWQVESREDLVRWVDILSVQQVSERKQNSSAHLQQLTSQLDQGWKDLYSFLKK